jgi:ATP-binding cassette subfamily F protein 3
MCHALTVALQEFEGAVVVVSHDRHLLRNTVEELLLVADGKVQQFDGDLQDYSNWLLSDAKTQRDAGKARAAEEKGGSAPPKLDKKAQRQQSAEQRKQVSGLKQQLQKIERELDTGQKKLADVEQRLGDGALYDDAQREQLQKLLKEQDALRKQCALCEEQWLALQEQLEQLAGE